jgi:hypothetical protein
MEMSENVEKNAKCTCEPSAPASDSECVDVLILDPRCPEHGDFPPLPHPEPAQSVAEPPPAPEPVPPADPAAAFVEAVVAVDRRAFTSTAEIMTAARAWCDDNGALPFGPRALAAQLKRRRGVQPHSNGQRRGWRGIKLR